MKLATLLLLCATLLPLVNASPASLPTTHEWLHQLVLDSYGNYHVKWHFDLSTESIVFSLCVRTQGWIGFGFSPNGGMTGSDLVIIWVDASGRAHLQVSVFGAI